MPAEASSNTLDPRCLSLEELFQRFPGLATSIAGFLDEDGKTGLRMCSLACKAAVDPVLTRVRVWGCIEASLKLLQSPNWRHLQELHMGW